jgi:hypothetical protein
LLAAGPSVCHIGLAVDGTVTGALGAPVIASALPALRASPASGSAATAKTETARRAKPRCIGGGPLLR